MTLGEAMHEIARLRACIHDVFGLKEKISEDPLLISIGQRPDGTWCAWHDDYPDEGAISLEATPDGLPAALLALSTDCAQDALEDPVGHAEREAAGFYRIGRGAMDALRPFIMRTLDDLDDGGDDASREGGR